MLGHPFLRSWLFEEASEAAGGGGGGANDKSQNTNHKMSGEGGGGAGEGFDFRTVVDAKGEFVQGWQDKLPGDFDPYRAMLANHKSFGGLAKSLADSMTAARAKTEGMVKIPGADANPEERAAFLKSLGVPEKPEDYALKAPEKMPEALEWNEAFAGGAKAAIKDY